MVGWLTSATVAMSPTHASPLGLDAIRDSMRRRNGSANALRVTATCSAALAPMAWLAGLTAPLPSETGTSFVEKGAAAITSGPPPGRTTSSTCVYVYARLYGCQADGSAGASDSHVVLRHLMDQTEALGASMRAF